jgi:hypothetical protein
MKNGKKDNSSKEIPEKVAIDRLNKKTEEMKKRFKVPPEFEDEPNGLLSGGPEHLDIPDDLKSKK